VKQVLEVVRFVIFLTVVLLLKLLLLYPLSWRLNLNWSRTAVGTEDYYALSAPWFHGIDDQVTLEHVGGGLRLQLLHWSL
jgi:hypothetical protein